MEKIKKIISQKNEKYLYIIILVLILLAFWISMDMFDFSTVRGLSEASFYIPSQNYIRQSVQGSFFPHWTNTYFGGMPR